MVLSTTKRTSSISSIVNQNQGGGEKKAGLPYIVGRNHWSNIYLNPVRKSLPVMQMTLMSSANTVRPTNVDSRLRMR